MRRNAEMLGQIVVYVIGLIVIASVLYFGYSIIDNYQEKRCEVKRIQFATDLSSFLDRNRAWGVAGKTILLDAPCGTVQVCFVERAVIDERASTGDNVGLSWIPGTEPAQASMIQGSVNSLDPTNVFTVQDDGRLLPVERFSASAAPIAVQGPENAYCVTLEGDRVDIRVDGDGENAIVGRV